MLVHFADLKHDLLGEIRRIAAFLDIPIDDAAFPAIVEHSSFDYMKRSAAKSVPLGGACWEGGAQDFYPQGHEWPLARCAERPKRLATTTRPPAASWAMLAPHGWRSNRR